MPDSAVRAAVQWEQYKRAALDRRLKTANPRLLCPAPHGVTQRAIAREAGALGEAAHRMRARFGVQLELAAAHLVRQLLEADHA